MQTVGYPTQGPTAIRTNLGAIFVSLELSRSTWLITSLSPGGGENIAKKVARWRDGRETRARFAPLARKRARTRKGFPFVVIQEAGLDGFGTNPPRQKKGTKTPAWNPPPTPQPLRPRLPKTKGTKSRGSPPSSIQKRGKPRVCARENAPTPEEDHRRLCRHHRSCSAGSSTITITSTGGCSSHR